MSDDLFGAPAGWYPDPLGLPQLRWWNNHAWTEQTSAARQPMVVQDTKFAWADDEMPTRREERERERSGTSTPAATTVPTAESLRELEPPRAFTQVSQGVPSAPIVDTPPAPAAPAAAAPAAAPTAAPAAPSAAPTAPAAAAESLFANDPIVETVFPSASPTATPTFDRIFDAKPAAAAPEEALDALFGAKATRRSSARVKTPIYSADQLPATATAPAAKLPSATGPAWGIAMIPLLQLVVSLLLLTSLGQGTSSLVFIAILVIPYFIAIGLAYFDNKALKAAGYAHPAAWGWAFLTAPVYLLVRARTVIRETGHGIGPVLVWFGLGVMHLASFVAIPGLIIALLPAMFTAQIEQSAADDAMLISTTQMTLDCPETPPVLQGERIICPAVSGTGTHFDVTVTLERANGWIDWQVIDWGAVKNKTDASAE